MTTEAAASPNGSGGSSKPRLPRYSRVEGYPEIKIGLPKQKILASVGKLHYLSAPQISKLVFSPKTITYARDHLKELYQSEYLERIYLPRSDPWGSSLAIYCLDRNGIRYLRKINRAPTGRFHRTEEAQREDPFLQHTLDANELIVQCVLLAKHDPSIRLVRFVGERELKRRPGVVRMNGRRVKVIPDGWVHLEKQWPGRDAPSNYYIAWELDRSTTRQKAFRRKIRALTLWMDRGYIEQFGVEGLTIGFVTTGGKKRLAEMISWTEEELERMGKEEYGELFLFTAFNPQQVTSEQLFNQPHWYQLFDERQVRLIEQPS